ncbi:MAG: deacylase [Desulfovibrio sp.]|nr:deacylase [Desulfovibrio sp.]
MPGANSRCKKGAPLQDGSGATALVLSVVPVYKRDMRCFARLCFLLFCFLAATAADGRTRPLDFTTIRLGGKEPVVLIVGGIQGDEPGGFSAATLVATRYAVKNGAVWVVPNLNFPSIIMRSRGLNGDMNRKFAALDARDPDFSAVSRIQELIRHPQVKLVLNLHDGSGYYREEKIDALRNPLRWGQSVIIDQERMDGGVFMAELGREARQVTEDVNSRLVQSLHKLHVHNTNTAAGDREMEKSLSWYAVRHGKAAFGLEASKEFPVELRVYYHLCMVESLLRQAGIDFFRDFDLTPESIRQVLQADIEVSFAEKRVFLPLDNARPAIGALPLPQNSAPVTSKPIMAVLPCRKNNEALCIHYGNRTLTRIRPDWREMDDSLSEVRVTVDGREKLIRFGEVLPVAESLLVHRIQGFRVNVIGFPGRSDDDSGVTLRRQNFLKHYSVDRQGTLYRVEVYNKRRLAGMFLARFGAPAQAAGRRDRLPAVPGPESALGF